ncbi:biopolymer transporter ExbD [Herbaspirillum sp. NPDC087042]|uniref:biopolymer transporter ExbD n=1 Tax=Herbaspirillum sp. NPDC087042 TaxID=3364004 RepID=UPI0037FDEE2B
MAGSSMRGGRTRKFKSEINVVPYIDVMLVLLIIFMVATPITNPSVINLPTAGKSTQPPSDYIEIALKPNTQATIRINGPKSGGKKAETVTGKTDLSERLRQLHDDNPDLAVMISADKDIKYDEVVQVISEAKKQGIARVGLATK